jgi:hypothetical protein
MLLYPFMIKKDLFKYLDYLPAALGLLGWFINKSKHFNFLEKLIVPKITKCLKILKAIDSKAATININNDKAFKYITSNWPILDGKSIAHIKTGNFVQYIDKISSVDMELIAFDFKGRILLPKKEKYLTIANFIIVALGFAITVYLKTLKT